uniref:Uncharacterized protein n=1 Tax=Physcomitrium patens TaxID=3218 RepID=A0A2K1KX48_PHYPA|nr:hypothetical protein PHYPA_005357 [Physcomitrium patens]
MSNSRRGTILLMSLTVIWMSLHLTQTRFFSSAIRIDTSPITSYAPTSLHQASNLSFSEAVPETSEQHVNPLHFVVSNRLCRFRMFVSTSMWIFGKGCRYMLAVVFAECKNSSWALIRFINLYIN